MFQLTQINSDSGLNNHTVNVQAVPFSIGRESESDFQLEEPGVWERHASISLDKDRRPVISIREDANCLLNEEFIHGTRVIKPGDILKVGEVNLRFDLSPCLQKSTLLQETCVYVLAGMCILSQFVCVYMLLDQ